MKLKRTTKINVPYNDICHLIEQGKTTYFIAQLYDFPRTVIERIRAGHDVTYYLKRNRTYREMVENMCECCGLEEIDRKGGLRKLCRTCFINPPISATIEGAGQMAAGLVE